MEIMPWSPIRQEPRDATHWEHVTRLRILEPPQWRPIGVLDLRREPWERLQSVRRIPILTHGALTNTVLVSAELNMEQVQRLLAVECHPRRHWQLIAANYDHWIIQSLGLLEHIQVQLDELEELRALQRGGMPEGDVITFRYLHDPATPRYYRIDHDNAVVADMVVDIATSMHMSSDDIAVFIEGGVPDLEEDLDPFVLVDVWVILLLFAWHDEFRWPWTVYDMIRVAVHQRGRTTRPYETRAFRIISAQSGGTVREDQAFLPDRGGQSVMATRGGMPRNAERYVDPRSAMIGWAVQKATEHVQDVHPNTMTMLCRAEVRTTHALLNSRSASQTKHILQAAFRRASLTYPTSSQAATQPHRSDSSEGDGDPNMIACMNDVLRALQHQTQMLDHNSRVLSSIPGREHHEAMMNMFGTSQVAVVQAIQSFTEVLSRMERKLETEGRQQMDTNSEDRILQRREDQDQDEPTTPVYSTPGIGEEGGETERDMSEPEQEQRIAAEDMETQEYQSMPDDNENHVQTHPMIEVNGTILIDDDDEPTREQQNSQEGDGSVAHRVSILEALAQRSNESQMRTRNATAPFGAVRQ